MFAYRDGTTTEYEYESGMMSLDYVSDPMPAGTYTVRITFWGVENPRGGSSTPTLTLIGGAFSYPPQLTIQEYTGFMPLTFIPIGF